MQDCQFHQSVQPLRLQDTQTPQVPQAPQQPVKSVQLLICLDQPISMQPVQHMSQ